MGRFDNVLLTVDYDRTLTAPDSTIPERNIEAIRWFMDNGGTFTVNTGRSISTFGETMKRIPTNAPFLLYNGSATCRDGKLEHCVEIQLDVWQTVKELSEAFPDMNLEIQGESVNYLVNQKPEYVAFYEALGWKHTPAVPGTNIGPFMKLALFGQIRENTVDSMFSGTPEELRRFDEAEEQIRRMYPGKVEVFRSAPRIIDIHAKGVSKLQAARDLQKRLGKKILVCVGDAENDVTMLDGADYAYCPSDGVLAHRYENVCGCAEGAVADVIYEKIPEILAISP